MTKEIKKEQFKDAVLKSATDDFWKVELNKNAPGFNPEQAKLFDDANQIEQNFLDFAGSLQFSPDDPRIIRIKNNLISSINWIKKNSWKECMKAINEKIDSRWRLKKEISDQLDCISYEFERKAIERNIREAKKWSQYKDIESWDIMNLSIPEAAIWIYWVLLWLGAAVNLKNWDYKRALTQWWFSLAIADYTKETTWNKKIDLPEDSRHQEIIKKHWDKWLSLFIWDKNDWWGKWLSQAKADELNRNTYLMWRIDWFKIYHDEDRSAIKWKLNSWNFKIEDVTDSSYWQDDSKERAFKGDKWKQKATEVLKFLIVDCNIKSPKDILTINGYMKKRYTKSLSWHVWDIIW